MEKIFEQVLLYDFYGELLTPHQRNIYEDAVCNDMSLGEIAKEHGISRQGVHDLIKRCDKILQDYERKLHLVARFGTVREKIGEIEQLTRLNQTGQMETISGEEPKLQERMERIRSLSREILKEL